MKIKVDYRDEIDNMDNLEIISAQHLVDYIIRLKFNDGIIRKVDFESFLKNSSNPSIRKYLQKENFLNFKLIDGNLNWNDYDLIFPIIDLYNNKIEKNKKSKQKEIHT